MTQKPKCINLGCNRDCCHDGKRFRPVCSSCHRLGDNPRRGVTAFKNNRCENHDGHLGWECPTNMDVARGLAPGLTQLDHKDGNHMNNVPENIQELCLTCHAIKSYRNGDFRGHRIKILQGAKQ